MLGVVGQQCCVRLHAAEGKRSSPKHHTGTYGYHTGNIRVHTPQLLIGLQYSNSFGFDFLTLKQKRL